MQYDASSIVNASEVISISKDYILDRITEETIFEHYGVPIKKGLFCSRLRKDDNPTVALYRARNGTLLIKDFGSNFCGDCFTYVGALFNVSYHEALNIVANDFGLIKIPKLKVNKAELQYSGKKVEVTKDSEIRVEIRDFQDYELKWWSKYGITENTLKKFNVFSCKNV